MENYTVQEHNATTGKVIVREMTDLERRQFEADKIQAAVDVQAQEAANTLRTAALAKLAALGLTTDDLKALGL